MSAVPPPQTSHELPSVTGNLRTPFEQTFGLQDNIKPGTTARGNTYAYTVNRDGTTRLDVGRGQLVVEGTANSVTSIQAKHPVTGELHALELNRNSVDAASGFVQYHNAGNDPHASWSAAAAKTHGSAAAVFTQETSAIRGALGWVGKKLPIVAAGIFAEEMIRGQSAAQAATTAVPAIEKNISFHERALRVAEMTGLGYIPAQAGRLTNDLGRPFGVSSPDVGPSDPVRVVNAASEYVAEKVGHVFGIEKPEAPVQTVGASNTPAKTVSLSDTPGNCGNVPDQSKTYHPKGRGDLRMAGKEPAQTSAAPTVRLTAETPRSTPEATGAAPKQENTVAAKSPQPTKYASLGMK